MGGRPIGPALPADPNGYDIELVYESPRELWEGDSDAALNKIVERPIVK